MSFRTPFSFLKPEAKPLAKPSKVVHTQLNENVSLISSVTAGDDSGIIKYTIEPIGKERTQITITYKNGEEYQMAFEQFENHRSKGKVRFNNKRSVLELKKFLLSLEDLNVQELRSGVLSFGKLDLDSNLQDRLISIYDANPEKTKDILLSVLEHHAKITGEDIKDVASRKEQVVIFEELLSKERNEDLWANLKSEYGVSQDEKVLERFLKENEWILGYGLDYAFNVVEDELKKLEADDGQECKFDIVLSANRVLNIVELKKHDEPIFQAGLDGHNNPKFNTNLTEYVFQIQNYLRVAEEQRTKEKVSQYGIIYEPCGFLIIGNTREFTDKQKIAFEVFRKGLKSPRIFTYDELLNRAKGITNL